MSNPAIAFPNLFSALNLQFDSTSNPRLFCNNDSRTERAAKVKQLLLDLSKDETDQELKSAYRKTADFFRESFFGLTEKQIRARIKGVLEEYFDGETYTALEIENISEETGIGEDKLLPVIEKMVNQGIVERGRRRRFNEPGKHYNFIYRLKK